MLTALIVLIIAAFAAVTVVSFSLFRYAICRPKPKRENQKKEDGKAKENDPFAPYRERIKLAMDDFRALEPERVSIVSFDGLHLTGQYLPADGVSCGSVIMMHGYHSGLSDFACQCEFFRRLGFDILIPDQRAHGQSEGEHICFGVFECSDCRDWAYYLAERNGERDIFLYGVSMGGATVLYASALELPSCVRGIIADCAFTSPYDIFKLVLNRSFHMPTFPFLHLSSLISKVIAGFSFREADTTRALELAKVPILFIHGGADDFVPAEMTLRSYRAAKCEKELLIIPDAWHAQSYVYDTERYESVLGKFLKKHSSK